MKILILVVHGPYEPWLEIMREGQLRTWATDTQNTTVVHVSGKPVGSKIHKMDEYVYSLKWSERKLLGKSALIVDYVLKKFVINWLPKVTVGNNFLNPAAATWLVEMPDFALLMGNKMLASLNHSLEYEYDYLVTTITSAYINIPKLEQTLEKMPRNSFAGGRITEVSGNKFQQGSFRVYSKDVVEWIIANRTLYPHWLPEDVAMGKLIEHGKYSLIQIPDSTAYSIEELESLSTLEIEESVHFRCKGSRVKDQKHRNDVVIQQKLHQLIGKE